MKKNDSNIKDVRQSVWLEYVRMMKEATAFLKQEKWSQ